MNLTQPLEDANTRAEQLKKISGGLNLPVEDAIIKTLKEGAPVPEGKYDFNHKFKRLFPSAMERLNPNYINTNNKLSGVVYSAGLAIQKSTVWSLEKLRALSGQVYTASVATKTQLHNAQEMVVLLGQKAQVLKSKEKIEKSLKEAGVSFDNILVNRKHVEPDFEKINHYLKAQSIKMGYDEHLNIQDPETYNLSVLKNPSISGAMKKEIIEKVVWPKIKHEIQQSMALMVVASNLKTVDPYMKHLSSAAKENNLTQDALIYILTNSPQMLIDLKSTGKVLANADKILESNQKYTSFISSATYIASYHTNLAKMSFHNYLTPEENKSFMEDRFLLWGSEYLNLKEIDENLNKTGFIEQMTVGKSAVKSDTVSSHPQM